MTSKKDKMRSCKFEISVGDKFAKRSGYFHRWSNVIEYVDGVGVQVVKGICETDNGEIHLANPATVRFTDRTQNKYKDL